MRYRIESRLQDEGWKYDGQEFDYLNQAVQFCKNEDGFFWGMMRVIDMVEKTVVVEFPAVSAKEKQAMQITTNMPKNEQKLDYTKKGDSMVRKEFVFAMLGAPIVSLEITDEQYTEIANRIKRVMDVYKSKMPEEMLSILEEEGVLAHVKYAIGRIRAKYTVMPGQDNHLALDGRDLAAEGLESIRWWYEMLESY
ncbi:MAG: hypothetical protein M0R80_01870 [Proteobacteria bacterium]|jgi:hypothetical protein|nr:hypothetical protein [Pseudomonadota bacterium]